MTVHLQMGLWGPVSRPAHGASPVIGTGAIVARCANRPLQPGMTV
jgi:hypothetical protein